MTTKRKIVVKTKDDPVKRPKRQTDLAAGFAAQILKSPRKVSSQASIRNNLELEDVIEVSSDDEDRHVTLPSQKSSPQNDRYAGKPIHAYRAQKDLVKDEPIELELGSTSNTGSSSKHDQRSTATQTEPSTTEESWLNRIPLRKVTDLAVHKKKITDVQDWLEGAFRNVSNKTVLILTGPAGVGKTATVETLAHVLDYDIIEWKNPVAAEWSDDVYSRESDSLAQKFERFLSISDKYSALDFGEGNNADKDDRRKVIVVEDIPNTFSSSSNISSAKVAFQNSIKRYLASPRNKYPLILIITETEPRGEDGDWRRSDAMSVRSLMSRDILDARNCTQITFNEVAPTFISKALARLVDALPRQEAINVSQAVLDEIATTANGDIRSAINTLHFISHRFSTQGRPARPRRKKKRGEVLTLTQDELSILNIITNRESALGYFHAMGKVLYNKSLPSSTPQPLYDELPAHLAHEARSRPENDASVILEETSTDSSTFLSGIHQNYIPSTPSIEQCATLLDHLSLVDASTPHYSDAIGTSMVGLLGVMGSLHALSRDAKRQVGAKVYFPSFTALRKRIYAVLEAFQIYVSEESRLTALGAFSGGRVVVDDAILDRVSYHALIIKQKQSSDSLEGGRGEQKGKKKRWFGAVEYDRFSVLGRGGIDAKTAVLDEEVEGDDDQDEVANDKKSTQSATRVKNEVHDTVEDDEIEEVD